MSFATAVAQVLKDEGGYSKNVATGEVVNFGITLSFVKGEIDPSATERYIQQLTVDIATNIYRKYFWHDPNIDLIVNDSLASLVFYLAVNQGIPTAIRNLQT